MRGTGGCVRIPAMWRVIFNIIVGFLALLAAGSAVLWGDSFWHQRIVWVQKHRPDVQTRGGWEYGTQQLWRLTFDIGSAEFSYVHLEGDRQGITRSMSRQSIGPEIVGAARRAPNGYQHLATEARDARRWRGFEFGRYVVDMSWIMQWIYRDASWIMPIWPITFLSSPLPIWWLRRKFKRRDLIAGRCSRCGYDMRATPNRCPECGMAPKSQFAAQGSSAAVQE